MPTIRVDDDVYRWLKSLATPFEDNPNSVLRRVAELEGKDMKAPRRTAEPSGKRKSSQSNDIAGRLTGKRLNQRWNVNARHALYHVDGTFYENLRYFPGALFEPSGYVLFRTEDEYRSSPYLSIGQKLNVQRGISSIPGFMKMT
jgi:hypothetical protein